MRAKLLSMGMCAVLGLVATAQAQQDQPANQDERILADQSGEQGDNYSFSLYPHEGESEGSGHDGDYCVLSTASGFLYGEPYFKDWARPMGMPFEFEDPFINSDLRFVYIWHDVPNRSVAGGGEVQTWAVQGRVALTDRLQFMATKSGYTKTNLDGGDGWNDFEIGLKYALIVDTANDYILSGGIKWEFENGSAVGQGDNQVLQPFISAAKRWDRLGLIGHVAYQIPMQKATTTHTIFWNAHLNYELFDNFFPLVEFHGIHWLSNGDGPALGTDFLDVGSFGPSNVNGSDYFGCGMGFRWNIMEGVQLGATYEFPIEDVRGNENLQHQRLNFNLALTL